MIDVAPHIFIRLVSWLTWGATCLACLAFLTLFNQMIFDDVVFIAILAALGAPIVRGDYWPLSWATPIIAIFGTLIIYVVLWAVGFLALEIGIWST